MPVFLASLGLATALLAAEIAPPVHWHMQEPPPQAGFRHVPIAVFGAAAASAAEYASLLERLARDRWVLFLEPQGAVSTEQAASIIASLSEAATRRGFTSVDVIGAEQGRSLALRIADLDPRFIRRVLLLGATDRGFSAARSPARFKSFNVLGRNMDDATANKLLSEVLTALDGCHCLKAAP